jgi:hypothetical protein
MGSTGNCGHPPSVLDGESGEKGLAAIRRLTGMASRGTAAMTAAAGCLAGTGYYLLVTGKLNIDTGWGRRVRPLGPFGVQIAAPAETVFDVIAGPYLGRTPRAMSGKLRVLERGTDMVLAEHYTPYTRAGLPPPRWRPSRSSGRTASRSGWSAGRCRM